MLAILNLGNYVIKKKCWINIMLYYLLSKFHKLFDLGLFSFSDEGKILISNQIVRTDRKGNSTLKRFILQA